MTVGRKKKCRNIDIDIDSMICRSFGPIGIYENDNTDCLVLYPDEFQTIIYQDIDHLTMDIASSKMGISKTIYAGLYQKARSKLAIMLHDAKILHIHCPNDLPTT